MPAQVRCPACKARLTVAEKQVGKWIRCRECKEMFEARLADEDGLPRRHDEGHLKRPSGRSRSVIRLLAGLLTLGVVGGAGVLLLRPDWLGVAPLFVVSPIPVPAPAPLPRPEQEGSEVGGSLPPPQVARRAGSPMDLPCKPADVLDIVFTLNGEQVGVVYRKGSADHHLALFDPRTGQSRGDLALPGIRPVAAQVRLTPDGSRVAYLDTQDQITVLNVTDGMVVRSGFAPYPGQAREGNTIVAWMSWVEGNKLLTVHQTAGISLWELGNPEPLYHVPPARIGRSAGPYGKVLPTVALALAPGGQLLAVYNGSGFTLIETATGETVGSLASPAPQAKTSSALRIAFRPDGKQAMARMAAEGGQPDYLVRWDTATGKVLQAVPEPKVPRSSPLTGGPQWWGDRHILLWSSVHRLVHVVNVEKATPVCNVAPVGVARISENSADGRLWCVVADQGENQKGVLVPVQCPDTLPADGAATLRIRPGGLDRGP